VAPSFGFAIHSIKVVFFTPFVLNYRGLGTGPELTVVLSVVVLLFSPSETEVPWSNLNCLSHAFSRSMDDSILKVLRDFDSSTPMSTIGNSDYGYPKLVSVADGFRL
jgi:hypothetical protein